MHRYFAYGSNLLPRRLHARVAIAADLGGCPLWGWRLCFHKRGRDGSGKGDIVRGSADDVVHGAVYVLDDAARRELDRIEGVGHGYRIESLELAAHGSAFCYVAEAAHIDAGLTPFDWYLSLVRAGARVRGASAAYLADLDRIPTQRDPDPQRAEAAWALLAD